PLPHSALPLELHCFPTRRSSDLLRFPAHVKPACAHLCVLPRMLSALARIFPFPRAYEARLRASSHFLAHVERVRAHLCVLPRMRSEEHTSELQSRFDLVCRLLLE